MRVGEAQPSLFTAPDAQCARAMRNATGRHSGEQDVRPVEPAPVRPGAGRLVDKGVRGAQDGAHECCARQRRFEAAGSEQLHALRGGVHSGLAGRVVDHQHKKRRSDR